MTMGLQIEQLSVSDLRRYEANARTHDDEQVRLIAGSIREFGFTNPVLVDSENILIAGHGRLAAAELLGLEYVPAIRLANLSPEKVRALRIADNQIALHHGGGWDLDVLRSELMELEAQDYELSILGFDERYLDDLLAGALTVLDGEHTGEHEIAPEPPEPDGPTVSRRGDIWELGEHRVMCGDSTSIDDIKELCEADPVDLLLTDPPYNVAYEGKTADALTIANDSMTDGDFRAFLVAAYRASSAMLKPGGVFYIWHADSEGFNFRGAAHDVGWKVRQCLIWVKNSLVLGRQDYQWRHEPCLYGWKDGAAHYWSNERSETTVLEFDRPSRNDVHPTMKPVALFEYQMRNSSRRGEVVLDPFGGSGTTLIAAENSGRVARLMEIDERYTDVIVRRWQEATGRSARLVSTGETFAETERERVTSFDCVTEA